MRSIPISGARGYFAGFPCRYFTAQGDLIGKATRHHANDFLVELDAPEQCAALELVQAGAEPPRESLVQEIRRTLVAASSSA